VPELAPLSHTSRRCPSPQFFPSPHAEPLAARHLRGRWTPPSSPSIFFHARPPCLTPTRPQDPPPLADAIRLLGAPETVPSPLNEFDQRTTLSLVSGEDRRPHTSILIFPAQLTPHLTLPLTDLQGRRWIALVSHPPPSELHHAGLSPPPHRRPTSSVSRIITHLAHHTPPTALVPLPSTPQQGSRRQAVAACTTAPASAAVTAPRRARACTVGPTMAGPGRHAVVPSSHSRPPTHVVPRHCGLGPKPRLSAGLCFFFSFRFSKIPRKCLESLKIIENRV
jgi:hypothetical protein